jgi:hypothetical protein
MISALSLLFLDEVHRADRGEKSGIDGLPGSDGGQRDDLLAANDRQETPGLFE